MTDAPVVLQVGGLTLYADGCAEITPAPAVAKPALRLFNDKGIPVNQPRPTFHAAADGNRFAWILEATKELRIQEQAANEVRRIRQQAARRYSMPTLVPRADAK